MLVPIATRNVRVPNLHDIALVFLELSLLPRLQLIVTFKYVRNVWQLLLLVYPLSPDRGNLWLLEVGAVQFAFEKFFRGAHIELGQCVTPYHKRLQLRDVIRDELLEVFALN